MVEQCWDDAAALISLNPSPTVLWVVGWLRVVADGTIAVAQPGLCTL